MKIRRVLFTIFILTIFCTAILFNSCSDDSVTTAPPPPVVDALFPMGSEYAIGARALVTIYLEESLKVGYNNVYIVLNDSVTNATINDAHITFDNINHGSGYPVVDPPKLATDGKFKGAWILNASQSGDNNLHWHYHIHVHNHEAPGEPEGEAEFGDFVVRENPGKLQYITMPDSTKLYLSYIKPKNPASGINDFQFYVNRDEITQFPADGSYSITVNPVYISDGHTTTGNTNPTGNSTGYYDGRINLDRSGAWLINLTVAKNGISRDTFFELSY